MADEVLSSTTKLEGERIPIVELSGVYKIFKQKKIEVMALRGIDLKIYPGELIVIMGPSGSGKTTLLNCLCGIERPNAGSVKIKGMEITKLRDEGIQKLLQEEIGIVFQSFNLIPSLTAAGNVELPMIVLGKLSKSERRARVEDLLKKVGLEHRIHHRPSTLSGGEKQRLSIAMAFANDPSIVIADEPTANVDSVSAENIMTVFKEFMASNPNKALLIVTHDPALRKIADYTLVIRDGQFVRRIESMQKEGKNYNQSFNGDDFIIDIHSSRTDTKTSQIIQQKNYPYLKDIEICPHCHSRNIVKKLDVDEVFAQICDNKVIERTAIFCKECNEISYITITAFDLEKAKLK
ncbi:MAG: ABC transporter ATP-binding protein [Candidatus Lokiarchaeota archaeon]|nr:ABC transporter ATP-binding protein [Candidatus Harpocratesius repetitus]